MSSAPFKGKHEAVHELLYRAHWLITAGANELHKALVACQDAGRYDEDRRQLAPIIAALEVARKHADDAWLQATEARTKIIQFTGCDGKCSDRAREKEPHP